MTLQMAIEVVELMLRGTGFDKPVVAVLESVDENKSVDDCDTGGYQPLMTNSDPDST